MTNKKLGDNNIFDEFPFMQAFPFDEYQIEIEKDDLFYVQDENMVIDFSSVPGLKDLDSHEVVNFQYLIGENDIITSFHKDDIAYIDEVSDSIKKIDNIREILDDGIKMDDLKGKIKAIEAGDKFICKVSPDFKESKNTFKAVLDSIILLNGVEMSHKLVQNILELNKNIDITKLNVDEIKSILMYLDFQLHHAKIILGVVIAAKIY